MKRNTRNTTNLKTVDVAIVGGRWSGLAMAKEITTRSGLNVVVLEKKLRPDMQLLIVEGATHGRPGDQQQHSSMVVEAYAVVTRITSMAFNPRLDFQDYNRAGDLL